jgi:hypothetical protein
MSMSMSMKHEENMVHEHETMKHEHEHNTSMNISMTSLEIMHVGCALFVCWLVRLRYQSSICWYVSVGIGSGVAINGLLDC